MAADRVMERPLGPQEALFGELNRRANGAVQLTCIAAFDRPVEAQRLRSALRGVHERHPMLRARMQDRDRLWWVCDVPFERIDIRMQAPGSAVDLEALYAAEAGTPLDVSAVSWRAVCVTDELGSVAWLALTTNHAAIDARSALVVLNDLDRLLGEPVLCPGPPLPLMPYAEAGLAEAGLSGEGGLYHPWPEETKWAVEQPADSAARRPRALLRVFRSPTSMRFTTEFTGRDSP
ncbi:MAG: hypothetical protein HWD60_03775 [Defluviicoccus sp.]|nr:MAG: hypothetical protein HWD60_03775 [Defluviicoccus sp.]